MVFLLVKIQIANVDEKAIRRGGMKGKILHRFFSWRIFFCCTFASRLSFAALAAMRHP